MSGQGSGRRRTGGGTLPASGFTYIGAERAPTLNNGAPAHALNNGSLRSLPERKARAAQPDNFTRNVAPPRGFPRKQDNGYLRSATALGFPRRAPEPDYSEPEYSVIAEARDCARGCPHSNTFNC